MTLPATVVAPLHFGWSPRRSQGSQWQSERRSFTTFLPGKVGRPGGRPSFFFSCRTASSPNSRPGQHDYYILTEKPGWPGELASLGPYIGIPAINDNTGEWETLCQQASTRRVCSWPETSKHPLVSDGGHPRYRERPQVRSPASQGAQHAQVTPEVTRSALPPATLPGMNLDKVRCSLDDSSPYKGGR